MAFGTFDFEKIHVLRIDHSEGILGPVAQFIKFGQ